MQYGCQNLWQYHTFDTNSPLVANEKSYSLISSTKHEVKEANWVFIYLFIYFKG